MTCIKYYSTIDSTQLEAMRLIEKKNLDLPMIIVTKKQSSGMGRKDRKWISDSHGNLYCSLLFHSSKIKEENINMLPFIACISIQEIINVDVQFKWPNDIIMHDKKICGILVQKTNDIIIIGVGLNLFCSPISIKNISTSLREEGLDNFQKEINQDGLISISLSIIDKIISIANMHDDKDIIDIWKKRAYRINQEITINGETGIFKDIDNVGRIVIENKYKTYKFSYGDVS